MDWPKTTARRDEKHVFGFGALMLEIRWYKTAIKWKWHPAMLSGDSSVMTNFLLRIICLWNTEVVKIGACVRKLIFGFPWEVSASRNSPVICLMSSVAWSNSELCQKWENVSMRCQAWFSIQDICSTHVFALCYICNVFHISSYYLEFCMYSVNAFCVCNLCVNHNYRQVSNISRTLAGFKIVDHSDVVGASPVGVAPTTSSFST